LKLQIEQVTKAYKGKVALAEFDAELSEGVHALLGPNGAGKSTLLRIMSGVLNPSSGRVLLDGENIVTMGERYRDILGYLPQSFGLYKNFTVEGFLMYIAALKGLDKSTAADRVTESLQLVHLEDARHIKVGNVSGGMKQRIGIAQALLNNPRILIMDEPTAGLDPKERIRFRNLLGQLATDRIVVLSTHIISDVEFMSQDILLLKQGRLMGRNTPNGFRQQMEDKVWIVPCSESEVGTFQEKFLIGNMTRTGGGIELRILSDVKPATRAKAALPTLEDMYLYYFGEEAVNDEAVVFNKV
jgi:ABC-2 type transport system ATP-binding protein